MRKQRRAATARRPHAGSKRRTSALRGGVAYLASLAATACIAVAAAQPPADAVDATEGADPPVRTLSELTQAAEDGYPGVEAASHAIAAAEARLGEIRLSPFFQFTATGTLGITPDAGGTPTYSEDGQLPLGNGWGPILGVDVRGAIPVYTFGKLRAARRAGRAGVRGARQDRERARAQLRFDVRRAYFGLQLALDIAQMISEGEGRLRSAVRTLQAQIDDEDPDVNPLDQYRLTAALAEVEARKSQALLLEHASRAALSTLTGIERVRVPDCPIARVPFDPEALEEYTEQASSLRPEMAMLAAAQEAREADLTAHRARFFPDLVLALRAGYSYSPGVTDVNNPYIQDRANAQRLTAALVLRWNLDFAGSHYRTQRSRAQLAELRARTREADAGIRLQVAGAYEQLADADRREQAWSRGERATRSWFVAAGQAYQLGTAEPRDLVDALKAYFTNRFNHLESVREYNTAVARLEQMTGAQLLQARQWDGDCAE